MFRLRLVVFRKPTNFDRKLEKPAVFFYAFWNAAKSMEAGRGRVSPHEKKLGAGVWGDGGRGE